MKLLSKLLKLILFIIQTILLVWTLCAWWLWDHIHEQQLLFSLFTIACLSFLYITYYKKRIVLGWVLFSFVIYLWFSQQPTHERDWVDYQEKIPFVTIDENHIHIQNVRHDLRYLTDGKLEWLHESYNLNQLKEVHFALVTFTKWQGLAHLFLSFNFNDEKFLSVSGEIRREKNEDYSPFKGLFRNYEKMIVLGTEKDVIGLRIFKHKDPVNFYPLNMSNDNSKALLISLLKDCQSIQQTPRFYNTLTQNCATLIKNHLENVYQEKHPFDLRLIFPGFADEIGVDHELIKTNDSIDQMRKSFLINDLAETNLNGTSWSLKIRQR